MSSLICARCGGQTNTAVSDHLDRRDGKAEKCWLKWENGTWVKGCSYDECSPYVKPTLEHLLTGDNVKPTLEDWLKDKK